MNVTDLPERMQTKIVITASGCWQWTGARNYDGYGMRWIRLANGSRVQRRVHRLVYEALVGPIPANLEIDHLCRNRLCCNPVHLEPVTTRINNARGFSPSQLGIRARLLTGKCTRGHDDWTPKGCGTCKHIRRKKADQAA